MWTGSGSRGYGGAPQDPYAGYAQQGQQPQLNWAQPAGEPPAQQYGQAPGGYAPPAVTQTMPQAVGRLQGLWPPPRADEMLNQGFKEQIYDVYRYLPPSIQARIPPIQYLARLLTAVDGC
ncbi:hypothetical protein T484DRAFT_1809893 [Baffinella frigidus]|nr:hypothetical protein T484DRAFT_1809893 [Cryptophyta sp. CCMP2293]